MKKLLVSAIALSLLTVLPAQAITPLEIIKKTQDITRGDASTGTMEMLIVKPKWQRKLTMQFWENRKTKKFLTLIISPKKEKGVGSLKIDKSMWNYLPKVEKVMKIPPSLMLQPWMGSDFTNDDLVKEISLEDDYSHQLLGEEKVDNILCYKLKLVPNPDVAVVWGKVHYFVDKKRFLPVRQEFYSEKGTLVKVMKFSEFKMMNNRLVPTKMEMVPVTKENQKTVVFYKEINYDAQIDDDIFSLRNLKAGGQ